MADMELDNPDRLPWLCQTEEKIQEDAPAARQYLTRTHNEDILEILGLLPEMEKGEN